MGIVQLAENAVQLARNRLSYVNIRKLVRLAPIRMTKALLGPNASKGNSLTENTKSTEEGT